MILFRFEENGVTDNPTQDSPINNHLLKHNQYFYFKIIYKVFKGCLNFRFDSTPYDFTRPRNSGTKRTGSISSR